MRARDLQRGELRTDPMATVKSKLKKFGFFTPIAFYSLGLETDISYRNLKTFFSDLWTDMRAQPVLDVVESRETIA
jgi:hypothetical protein